MAELVRKKTEACVTAIVFGDDEAQQGIAPAVIDADGNRVEQFEPGLIAYARGGKDIRFNQPAATGGYGEYKRASLHTIAAGFRVPYELLTGDLSQVNYSSIRAGLVEFRRHVDAVQWQLVFPMLCAPVWRWFIREALSAGLVDRVRQSPASLLGSTLRRRVSTSLHYPVQPVSLFPPNPFLVQYDACHASSIL